MLQPPQRVGVLFNGQSGGVSQADLDTLIEALVARGIPQVDAYDIEGLEALLGSTEKFDYLVVLGGDGTARAAAARTPPDGPPLIILPGGTMNILPNALNGALTWTEALDRAFETGEVRRLAGGVANGQRFFIAAIFGTPALLARAREAVRKGRFIEMFQRLRYFVRRAFSRRLHGAPQGGARRDGEAIGVLCGAMFGAPDDQELEWVHLDANSFLELARVGVSTLGPDWREDPAVHALRCSGGSIRGVGVIPAILDGEPHEFVSPIAVTLDANGPLVVCQPQQKAARTHDHNAPAYIGSALR